MAGEMVTADIPPSGSTSHRAEATGHVANQASREGDKLKLKRSTLRRTFTPPCLLIHQKEFKQLEVLEEDEEESPNSPPAKPGVPVTSTPTPSSVLLQPRKSFCRNQRPSSDSDETPQRRLSTPPSAQLERAFTPDKDLRSASVAGQHTLLRTVLETKPHRLLSKKLR